MALAIRISNITKGSTNAVMVSSPSSNQASTYIKKEVILKSGFDSHLYFLNFSEEVRQIPIHYQTTEKNKTKSLPGKTPYKQFSASCFIKKIVPQACLSISWGLAGVVALCHVSKETVVSNITSRTISCMPLLSSITETKYLTSQLCEFTAMLTRSRQGPVNAEALWNLVQVKADQLSSI